MKDDIEGKHGIPLKGPCNGYIMLPGSQGPNLFYFLMPSDQPVVHCNASTRSLMPFLSLVKRFDWSPQCLHPIFRKCFKNEEHV